MTSVLYAASTFGHLRSFHIPYLAALVERGYRVVAVGAGDPYGLPAGPSYISLPFTKSFASPRNIAAAATVVRMMRAERFDAVFVHTSLAAFFVRLGVLLAGKRSARVVNTVHGYLFDDATPRPKRTVLLAAERAVAGATDDILTMNARDKVIAERYRLCRGTVYETDGMGVDLSRCRPAGHDERLSARHALGLADDAFVLLYAAEFSARKNQGMLVDALERLPRNVVLALPGAGDLREACRSRADELGLRARVAFPGFVDDLAPWRAAADVCVSASRIEGLPSHAVEAMACGLPVVLSAVKGHEDLVGVDCEAGLLYPFGDTGGFCACVGRLQGDSQLRARMGAAARTAAQRYDVRRVLPRTLGLMCGDL